MRAAGQNALAVCSIVVTELLFGALRSNNISKNLAEVRQFVSGFVSLAFDDAAAERHAEIWAQLAASGTIIGPLDLQIAAIALAHNLTLVTHNTSEFLRVPGLRVEDWQAAP
jgi:tRNA(fMet)-specific endonuclease VapC